MQVSSPCQAIGKVISKFCNCLTKCSCLHPYTPDGMRHIDPKLPFPAPLSTSAAAALPGKWNKPQKPSIAGLPQGIGHLRAGRQRRVTGVQVGAQWGLQILYEVCGVWLCVGMVRDIFKLKKNSNVCMA